MSEAARRRACLMLITLPATGCSPGFQSALEPAGPFAAVMADHFWYFTYICGAVWLLVVAALVWALLRRRRAGAEHPIAEPPASADGRLRMVVGIAVAATVLILIGFNISSYLTDKRLDVGHGREVVTIHLKGHRWWWEAVYEQDQPYKSFTTANEIHIPVGRPVKLKLTSSDVIHSFWVPNLTGKEDLVPQRENDLFVIADKPGIYRAQCAEFCGLQHAHMALVVVAEPKASFDAWLASSLRPAEAPRGPVRRRGLQVFQGGPCAACHTIRGTTAGGRMGPDLTHIASRHTLASGALPNTIGNLAGWIADPQGIKPGVLMPVTNLSPEDLQALVAYLDSLR